MQADPAQATSSTGDEKPSTLRSQLGITLPYAVVGVLWIAISDLFVAARVEDPQHLTTWGIAKGWVFVGATTALLWVLVARATQRLRGAQRQRDAYLRRLEHLVEHLRGVPYLCRNDGRWTMLRMDGDVEAVFGYSRDELVMNRELPYIEVIHPEDRALVRHWVRQAVAERRSFEMRYRVVRKDGEVRWVAERGSPGFDDETGRATMLEGYIYDDSKVARLESELRHLDKMNAIERVVGSAAHDFNNYLMAIAMNADMLAQNGKAENEAKQVRAIAQAAESAMNLSTKLLAFAHKRELQRERLDLNAIIRDRRALFESLCGAKVQLSFDLSDALLFIEASASEVEQVLTNLIINAVDASERGGRIEVSTARIEQGLSAVPVAGSFTEPVVSLRVRDDGHGMDVQTRERLFEPFFSTKGETGRGIGLAAVYGVVTDLGGRISVESAPGEGATFEIALPPS